MASKAASIPTATGIAWSEWDSWLIEQGALELPHPQIAKLALERVHDLGITTHVANGKPFNDGWWAQTIATSRPIASRSSTPDSGPRTSASGGVRSGSRCSPRWPGSLHRAPSVYRP